LELDDDFVAAAVTAPPSGTVTAMTGTHDRIMTTTNSIASIFFIVFPPEMWLLQLTREECRTAV
jgi:hypothetical protein